MERAIACARGDYGYVLGHCGDCGHDEVIAYCGCGDRNCPSCGGKKREEWAEKVSERFLPSRAFHVVFTLPHEFNVLIKLHPVSLLRLLMDAAAQTLLEFSASPEGLNGTPFLMTVLHTWTQELLFHPHVHALISAGALDADGKTWHEHQGNFLFPVQALSKVFRGKFTAGLAALVLSGEVSLPAAYQRETGLLDFLETVPKKWVVYAKPPYRSTQVVIRYFARYANRTAISNRRIISHQNGTVTVACRRDSAEPELPPSGPPSRTTTMSEEDFLFRFAQHIVPKGFHRIRYYGLMSPQLREKKRALLLAIVPRADIEKQMATKELSPYRCPLCKSGNTNVTLQRRNPRVQKREDSS